MTELPAVLGKQKNRNENISARSAHTPKSQKGSTELKLRPQIKSTKAQQRNPQR